MTQVNEVISTLKGLSIDDLIKIEEEIAKLKKQQALKELDAAEARVNELRRAAGMKARPPGKKKS